MKKELTRTAQVRLLAYFKVTGKLYTQYARCLLAYTRQELIKKIANDYNVAESDVNILEWNEYPEKLT